MLETYGHKGNIYILEDYDPGTWVKLGGEVYGFENLEIIKNGQNELKLAKGFDYKKRTDLVKTYKEIQDF